MSFTNPNETWEETEVRWAANQSGAIERESEPQIKARLIQSDVMGSSCHGFLQAF